MSEQGGNGRSAERVVVSRLGTWLEDWPTWVLALLFLALAVAFGLAGVLDDWLRVLLALLFVACALTLLARLFRSGEGGPPPNPPPPVYDQELPDDGV